MNSLKEKEASQALFDHLILDAMLFENSFMVCLDPLDLDLELDLRGLKTKSFIWKV